MFIVTACMFHVQDNIHDYGILFEVLSSALPMTKDFGS